MFYLNGNAEVCDHSENPTNIPLSKENFRKMKYPEKSRPGGSEPSPSLSSRAPGCCREVAAMELCLQLPRGQHLQVEVSNATSASAQAGTPQTLCFVPQEQDIENHLESSLSAPSATHRAEIQLAEETDCRAEARG